MALDRDSRGFSLIEVMVVVAIIALISAVALPSIRNYFKVSINSATRELGAVLKQAYNATVISGRVHRIAYDLEKNEFWVESGPANILLHTEKTLDEERQRKKFARTEEEQQQAEAEARAGFSQDNTVTAKKKSLPRGVKFLDVRTEVSREPITAGIAYTHIFAHGLTELTVVHLTDEQNHQTTLAIEPFVGRARIFDRSVPAEEIFELAKPR